MIHTSGGRTISVRERAELEALLRTQYKALTSEERRVLEVMLSERQLLAEGQVQPGQPLLTNVVKKLEWREPPVDMKTFVYDDYFLGQTCQELYPTHFDALSELFDRGGYHEAIFTGAIGCLRGDTPIHDPMDGTTLTVAERYLLGVPFHVWALSEEGPVIAEAWAPLKYPTAPMRRVVLESGETCVVTPHHRFWTGSAWVTADEVSSRLSGSDPVLLASSQDTDLSTHGPDAPRSTRTVPDSRAGCPRGLRSDGEPLPAAPETARGSVPSRGGVRGHSHGCQTPGAPVSTAGCTRCGLPSVRPSTLRFSLPAVPDAVGRLPADEPQPPPDSDWSSGALLPLAGSVRCCIATGPASDVPVSTALRDCTAAADPTSFEPCEAVYVDGGEWSSTGLTRVVRVEQCDPEPYYDFHVPRFNNYRACGLWHHNTGKSFAASIGVCRVLYEISCLRDPHAAYHIAQHTPIHIVCMSVTEDLAIKVAFDYIIEKIRASPYFTEKFPFRDGKKEFAFPNKITLAARATTDTSALGLNVIGVFLDESDFIKKPGKARQAAGEMDTAEKIYNKLRRRIKSRFARNGQLPGMMFVVSSKGRTDDFSARHIQRSLNDPSLFVQDKSLWDVKRDSYAKETFAVFVGNESMPSKILEKAEEVEFRAIAKANDTCVVIDVPENFRTDFERDLEDSIRDLAGIATVTVAPFIQRRERIQGAADYAEANGLKHAFLRNGDPVYDYVPGQGGEIHWPSLVEPARRALPGGGYEDYERPLLSARAPRHVHIDPSLTGDSTGFAMGHVVGWKEVIRRDSKRQEYAERAPVILVDFLLRIVPPRGDEIMMGDVRELVYQFSAHGYRIPKVTMDRFQSADGLQQLRAKGYDAEVLSVDLKLDPYEMLKTALYEGRLIFYGHPMVLKELRLLEKNHQTGRIDHPVGGSKDVADALAGIVYTLTTAPLASDDPLPLLRGVSYSGPSAEVPLVIPNPSAFAPQDRPAPALAPTIGALPLVPLFGRHDGEPFDPETYEP